MKTVFEASQTIEAHMLANVLEQQGIAVSIQGEHLQGGVGELQAMGWIRLVVDDDDYEKANKIISQWESQEMTKTQAELEQAAIDAIELPDEAVVALAYERKIEAIKIVREQMGLDLTQAKARVEAYLQAQEPGALPNKQNLGNSQQAPLIEKESSATSFLLLALGLGALAAYLLL